MSDKSTASRLVSCAAALTMAFSAAAMAQPVSIAEPSAVPPTIGMMYYRTSIFKNGVGYSWNIAANSREHCAQIAHVARQARAPGIDDYMCVDMGAPRSGSSPAAVPPVVGLLYYRTSIFENSVGYGWTINANSMEQCRAIAETAKRAETPGVDGGTCIDTQNLTYMNLNSHLGGFRLQYP